MLPERSSTIRTFGGWAVTVNGFAPRPAYRPLTKFENRGLKLGHRVWDVIFRRGDTR